MSQIEIKVNYILGIVLIIQAILCLICSIGYGITFNQHEKDYFYVFWNSYSSPVDSIIIFFTYFVLLNTMIPISLIVTIEIVKMFQKYFIEKDMLMHSIKRNCNVSVQSASLN
jgi:magnesium-transporting ATPase (P-type)